MNKEEKAYVKKEADRNLSIHVVTGFVPVDAICELPAEIPIDEAATLDLTADGKSVVVNPTKKAALVAERAARDAARAHFNIDRAARKSRLKSAAASIASGGLPEVKLALKDILDELSGN